MTAQEVREKFVEFFVGKGHTLVPAASLVPQDDPSVLFTTAGMQQFKPYYAQPERAPHKRVVTIQPCFRTSDIDAVGDDTHLTFFEMLGNFSFGYAEGKSSQSQVASGQREKKDSDTGNRKLATGNSSYFKREAIQWAWEFVTSKEWLGVDPTRIEVSVFRGEKNIPLDEESIRTLRALGISDKKIRLGDREDNFWGPTGAEGPCGPTTELYIDGMEVWNLVFNEYYQDADGNLIPSQFQGVDTGMGLERMLAVLNGANSVYETALYFPLLSILKPLGLSAEKQRIAADHIKGILFLINAGIEPRNLGREYILRRMLRRLMVTEGVLDHFRALTEAAFALYQEQYSLPSELPARVGEIVQAEWTQFSKTLAKGKVYITKLKKTAVSGKDAFHIYSTYGIPIDAQQDLFGPQVKVDSGGFEKEYLASFEQHRKISRAGAEKKFGGHGLINIDKEGEISARLSPTDYQKALHNHTATHLLHAALRAALGEYVQQKGSDVGVDRLRFDFSHPAPLTEKEKKQVEDWVNARIKEDLPVTYQEMDKDEALRSGALGFFPEKYPQKCKVYIIGDRKKPISMELCGGPHVAHTAEIGSFKITSEKSSGAGVRRIKAVTQLAHSDPEV